MAEAGNQEQERYTAHCTAVEQIVSTITTETELAVHDARTCEEVNNGTRTRYLIVQTGAPEVIGVNGSSEEEDDKKENKKKRNRRRKRKKIKAAPDFPEKGNGSCECEQTLAEQQHTVISQLDVLKLNSETDHPDVAVALDNDEVVPLQALNFKANAFKHCECKQKEETRSRTCIHSTTTTGKKIKQGKKLNTNKASSQSISLSGRGAENEVSKGASSKRKAKVFKNSAKKEEHFEKYMLPSAVNSGLATKMLIQAPIRINVRNYKEAYVNALDKGQDILIEGMNNRNRALEGDIVVVQLNPEKEWKEKDKRKQRTGKIVYISEKVHPRVGVGTIRPMPDKNKNFVLFSPRDSRIPRIKIPVEKCPENFFQDVDKYKTTLFLASIKDWTEVGYAIGEIVEKIGSSGDVKAETTAILLENDIEYHPFDIGLYQYFPRAPYVISEKELKLRADLRNECIFTIDPLTARDLDDAVSCKQMDNGNFMIGVHISDVSFFLHKGTPLDQAVSKRATSVYLVETVYHMLPKEMCLMCSLLPGEDKLAFSVFWEMTPEAEILNQYFTRSVINSCVQLAYEHAQEMLENPDKEWIKDELPPIKGNYTAQDLSRIVNQLNKLAIIMRKKRFDSGALRIDQPKVIFSLESGTGLPSEYTLYVNKECHRLIEEFMLLANMTVAKRLKTDFPKIAFLRSHPAPHEFCMSELQKAMEMRGIFLDVKSASSLQKSLWRYAGDDFVSMARMLVLNTLCAKPMARAKYFCSNFGSAVEDYWHYALSVPLYTHFTSPIRRYADIVVHRLLSGALGYTEKPDWDPIYVHMVASNCNKQKYLAKRAGEQSSELYLSLYIGLHSPMVEEAVVMDVKDLSFDVIICSTGLVQRVYTNHLPAKVTCVVEDKKVQAQHIEWNRTDDKPYVTLQVVEMFSIVTVELTRSPVSLKVDTKLLRPSSSGAILP